MILIDIKGGRDKRGGPILTFPSRPNLEKVKPEDLRRVVCYLSTIPRWVGIFSLVCKTGLASYTVLEEKNQFVPFVSVPMSILKNSRCTVKDNTFKVSSSAKLVYCI